MTKLKVGDRVRIIDGSYAVRVDKYQEYSSIGLSEDNFEILQINGWHLQSVVTDNGIHDIFIQDTKNGKIYLHSSSFVEKVTPIKELTMKDLEEHFGMKVKIVK